MISRHKSSSTITKKEVNKKRKYDKRQIVLVHMLSLPSDLTETQRKQMGLTEHFKLPVIS